ncbi:ATP-grasp domain-containing protein [Calidifontibacillus oryziterrae]|uniref:ATP-grasp domain-containing protein n=1 Tax=Calidifontibacillus oryziterrae TaxID=1191699 RepID=UPI0003147C21|nr:ATP-grasp domain-containing protein [Calidifontibacillus oryziterrae]
MKTIVFIGVNKSGSSREAVKAAYQLGYHTVVFTNRKKQLEQRKEYTDVHQLIFVDSFDIDILKENIRFLQHRGHEIIVITSFVDQLVYIASSLADEFCHNYLSTDAIYIMENKRETRQFFLNERFTPAYSIIEKDTQLPLKRLPKNLDYPVMVKCATSTGSKDVLFCDNLTDLQKNIAYLKERNIEETIIIEEYIIGDQYLVEVLVYNEQIFTAAVVQQEITRGKRFIITGYGVLAEVDDDLEQEIRNIVESITASLNIKYGAYHLELRQTEKGLKLIEINPRISGGAMNKMIHAAFGYSLVEETIKMLIGEVPTLNKRINNFVYTQHVTVKKKGVLEKVTGRAKARRTPGVVEVYVKPRRGTVLIPPMSMGHRYAYVIAIGDTMKKARKIAKEAAKLIKFHIINNDKEE